jgi:hypothetical protein
VSIAFVAKWKNNSRRSHQNRWPLGERPSKTSCEARGKFFDFAHQISSEKRAIAFEERGLRIMFVLFAVKSWLLVVKSQWTKKS